MLTNETVLTNTTIPLTQTGLNEPQPNVKETPSEFTDVFDNHPFETSSLLLGAAIFCCFLPICFYYCCRKHKITRKRTNNKSTTTDSTTQTDQQTSPGRVLPTAQADSDMISVENESVASSTRLNLQHLIDMNIIDRSAFESLSPVTQNILRSPVGYQFAIQIDTPSTPHSVSESSFYSSPHSMHTVSLLGSPRPPHTPAATTSPIRHHKPTSIAERITQRVIDAYGIIEPILFENRRAQSPGSI